LNRKHNDYHKTIYGVEYKQCKDCLEWFEMNNDNFGTDNKNKDKYNMSCIKCHKEYGHKYYINNKEKQVAQALEWRKKNHEKYKISMHKTRAKPKSLLRDKERSRTYREEGKASNWFKNNPDKVKKYRLLHKYHIISKKEWIDCKNYFNNTCAYCGLKIKDHFITRLGVTKNGDFHKEHRIHNGSNYLDNCIPSCGICNSSKRAKTLDEWYPKQEFFTKTRYNKIIKWYTDDHKLYINTKLPYKIIKKKNEDNSKFHHELWTIDDFGNLIECVDISISKKDLDISKGRIT